MNEAFSPATAISHEATSWHPAAAANPRTSAMTGTSILWINWRRLLHLSKTFWCDSEPSEERSSFKSCPDEKAGPSCAMITDRIWLLFYFRKQKGTHLFDAVNALELSGELINHGERKSISSLPVVQNYANHRVSLERERFGKWGGSKRMVLLHLDS